MDMQKTISCLKTLKFASLMLLELEKHFAKYDLSQAKFLVLIILTRSRGPSLSNAEIARQLGISKKNTTRLLAAMHGSKLITKKDHKLDARSISIYITEKGKIALKHVLPGYYHIINARMDVKNISTYHKIINELLNQTKATLVTIDSKH